LDEHIYIPPHIYDIENFKLEFYYKVRIYDIIDTLIKDCDKHKVDFFSIVLDFQQESTFDIQNEQCQEIIRDNLFFCLDRLDKFPGMAFVYLAPEKVEKSISFCIVVGIKPGFGGDNCDVERLVRYFEEEKQKFNFKIKITKLIGKDRKTWFVCCVKNVGWGLDSFNYYREDEDIKELNRLRSERKITYVNYIEMHKKIAFRKILSHFNIYYPFLMPAYCDFIDFSETTIEEDLLLKFHGYELIEKYVKEKNNKLIKVRRGMVHLVFCKYID
jgi:hypothetical protein